jgi:hypothetical protein
VGGIPLDRLVEGLGDFGASLRKYLFAMPEPD